MIVVTMERCDGTWLAHLVGRFEVGDEPRALAARLVAEAGSSPLAVDLSEVTDATGPDVGILVRALAGSRLRTTTALIHADLETRRTLRASSDGIPVVPSHEQILHGCFPSNLVARASVPEG